MKKSLETNVQSITPQLPEAASNFSSVFVMQHDEESLTLQHGNLYVVYDFSCKSEIDIALINKLVNDVLHNTYYTSQSASPIQPLEKAALELKERLVQLSKEYNELDIEFNIVMAVVWGEVLYIVSYGKSAMYLMRDSALKQIDSVSEGSFSIASGLVKDLDVVFLSTAHFVEQFTPEQIFKSTNPILQSELDPLSSAVVLKFTVVTEFSEDETLDIINPSAPLNVKKASDKKSYKLKKGLLKLRPSQTSRKKKIAGIIVLLVLASLFAFSVYALSQSNKKEQEKENVEDLIDRAKQLLSQKELSKDEKKELKQAEQLITTKAENAEEVKGVTTKIEKALNLKKVDSELFYDLALVDKAVDPSEMVFAGDGLYVADSQKGSLYSSTTAIAKFTKSSGDYANIKNLGVEYSVDDETVAEELAYSGANSFATQDLSTGKETETFNLQNPALIFPYLDYIYELDGAKITKYTKGATGTLTSATWITDDNLKQAVSFTIDGSIYVLLSDGTVNKYTSGERDAFMLVDFDVALLNPTRIVTNSFFDNMYILDKGNNRIVTIDKSGKFLTQYMDSEDKWKDLRDIAVSADEKTLYVLSGTKVFEVQL